MTVENSRNSEANVVSSPVDLRAEAVQASGENVTEIIDDSLDNELLNGTSGSEDDLNGHNEDTDDGATEECNDDGDVEMKDISGAAEDALNDVGALFDA